MNRKEKVKMCEGWFNPSPNIFYLLVDSIIFSRIGRADLSTREKED
jgi:hypothetical protein